VAREFGELPPPGERRLRTHRSFLRLKLEGAVGRFGARRLSLALLRRLSAHLRFRSSLLSTLGQRRVCGSCVTVEGNCSFAAVSGGGDKGV